MSLNSCPHCRNGHIFSSFLRMQSQCEVCEFVFARESGYFLGAMVASYMTLGATLVVWAVLGFWILKLPLEFVLGAGVAWVILATPLFFRLSRQLWIQLEHGISSRLK